MVGYHPEPINGQVSLTSTEYSEAGLASGIFTRMIIQPLDVLKIRFQLQEEPIRGKKSGKYKGVIQSVFLITREEGATAFWKGHVPAQGLSAIYGLVQFSSFEWLSTHAGTLFPSDDQAVKSSSDFFCGALSGCFAMTAAMPLDVIRTRLVAQKSGHVVYTSTLGAMKHIWRKEGISGYFRGWVPSVAQIAPFTGMQFALYNFFMDLWPFTEYESSAALFSGAMAGTVAKTVLYPLDMVRHRLQMNGFERTGFGKSSKYNQGLMRTIMMVIKHESWYGLFKGLWPSQIKAAANSGFAFLFYEMFCDIIRLIVSAQAAAFTISKLLFGVAADKTANSKLLTGGLLVCATASICFAFSSSFLQILVIQLLIGSVQGAGWVPATKLIAIWFNDSSYATMFSLLGCGSTLAGLLLPFFKQFYWRTALLNSGLSMIIFALMARYFISDDTNSSELKMKKRNDEMGILKVIKSSVIWHIALIYFFSMEMRTICETWVPLYLSDKNVKSDGFQILYEFGGLIGTITSGFVLDCLSIKFGIDITRRWIGIISTISMMFTAGFLFHYEEYATWVGFLTGFFVNSSINVWCLIGSQSGHSDIAGSCSAFISFIATSGSIFAGSPLASLIASYSYSIFPHLFLIQILFVMVLSLFNISLRMESKIKTN